MTPCERLAELVDSQKAFAALDRLESLRTVTSTSHSSPGRKGAKSLQGEPLNPGQHGVMRRLVDVPRRQFRLSACQAQFEPSLTLDACR